MTVEVLYAGAPTHLPIESIKVNCNEYSADHMIIKIDEFDNRLIIEISDCGQDASVILNHEDARELFTRALEFAGQL